MSRKLLSVFKLPELLKEIAHDFLCRALDEARGNKTRAAEFVGPPSYQTLTNWLAKYEVQE
jgi:DNA-binding NtrC family response regulator